MAKAKARTKAPASPQLTLVVPLESFGFREIMAINRFGDQKATPCQNPAHAGSRIPGLDAEGCSKCRAWWFDERYCLTAAEKKTIRK